MTKGDFDEIKLLSNKALVTEVLELFIRTFIELNNRQEITKEFLRDLCHFSIEAQVWFILWEGGGSYRFTDILHTVGCSRSKLTRVLPELMENHLVKQVDGRYQAISPAWLVSIREPNEEKT